MILRRKLGSIKRHILVYNKPKIFGIGANKTGTTSLRVGMQKLDFIIGNQTKAEKLIPFWAKRDFSKIIRYSYSAQFFQDIPFSLPHTFIALDQAFPKSKFILTVRDNPEQWYNSITSAHAKLWGRNNNIPTKEDLQNASYHYVGGVHKSFHMVFDTPMDDPYNKEIMIKYYEEHNRQVKDYFKHRPKDLLILNVAEKGAYERLGEFLGIQGVAEDFPWENKTENLKSGNVS